MLLNSCLAALLGMLLPLLFMLTRRDPATATAPVLTMLTDPAGFSVTLFLASKMLCLLHRIQVHRGKMFRTPQGVEKIIEECSAALRKNPGNVKAYISRAFAYIEMRAYARAIRDLTKAIHLRPCDRDLYYNRACHYLQFAHGTRRAIRDLSEVIRLDPRDAAAYANRGIAYARAGELDNALRDLTKALEHEPGNTDIRKSCGVVYYEKGEYDAALAQFSQLLAVDPEDAETNLYAGRALVRKGDTAAGVESLKRAADCGSAEAVTELKSLGIEYTPGEKAGKRKRTYWGRL